MKPLLVGEANPYQRNEEDAMRFALHPDPPRASGGRLCFVILGLDERTYLRLFDRTDLCFPKWSMPRAREKAAALVAQRGIDDVIVLCGSKVSAAFGVPYEPFIIEWAPRRALSGPRLVVLPHPSGLNRLWHQAGAIDRARTVLREVGVLPLLCTYVYDGRNGGRKGEKCNRAESEHCFGRAGALDDRHDEHHDDCKLSLHGKRQMVHHPFHRTVAEVHRA